MKEEGEEKKSGRREAGRRGYLAAAPGESAAAMEVPGLALWSEQGQSEGRRRAGQRGMRREGYPLGPFS
jgi:uncharacterized RDD family membrane protein YckC